MKHTIAYSEIVCAVQDMCIRAACDLPDDVLDELKHARSREQSPLAQSILDTCIDNAELATAQRVPICQDTGFAVYFVDIGAEVAIEGGTIIDAVNEGTRLGYTLGYLRASIVEDPLYARKNTKTNTPAVIHVSIVPGNGLSITLAPKGGGSENMGACAMLKPSDGEQGVIDFVVRTVIAAGGNPCPPTIVGVGIGGTMEIAALQAKKALLRPLGTSHDDPQYARLEDIILTTVNASGIGAQGLGGTETALAVHIATFPCHIASLPVAVALNCHAARHVTKVW
jgi:fumarate hydratase subunit alpha